MSNELYQHKKSDSIKWIITFTMLILLAISVIALGATVFGDGFNTGVTTEDETDTTTPGVDVDSNEPTTAEGMSTVQVVNSDLMMLSAMAYSAEPASTTNGVQVTATVLPEGTAQNLTWSVDFVNPSDTWATGKTASDYVSVTLNNETGTVVNVQALQAFGSQIKITATSTMNPDVSAYVTVDYAPKFNSVQYLGVDSNDFFASTPSSVAQNYVKGIPYLTASELANLYNTGIELDTPFSIGTIDYGTVTTEFMVRPTEEFLAALIAQGIAAKNADYTYLGDQTSGITAALLINTLTNNAVIPEADGTANNSLIQKFNAAAVSIGSAKAFDIMVQVITDEAANSYVFGFYFDNTEIPSEPTSIEFNVSNIVL